MSETLCTNCGLEEYCPGADDDDVDGSGCPDYVDSDAYIIEQLEAENKNLKSQQQPCSKNCFHHQTHPCEECGRINGYLPSVWQVLKG